MSDERREDLNAPADAVSSDSYQSHVRGRKQTIWLERRDGDALLSTRVAAPSAIDLGNPGAQEALNKTSREYPTVHFRHSDEYGLLAYTRLPTTPDDPTDLSGLSQRLARALASAADALELRLNEGGDRH